MSHKKLQLVTVTLKYLLVTPVVATRVSISWKTDKNMNFVGNGFELHTL